MASRKTRKVDVPLETVSVAVLVGRRLAKAREAAGLTQAQLADDLGLSKGHVSMAERGQRSPRLEVLMAWAARCGLTLSKLVGGLEDELLKPLRDLL